MADEKNIETKPMQIIECEACEKPITADDILCPHCGVKLYPFEPQYLYKRVVEVKKKSDFSDWSENKKPRRKRKQKRKLCLPKKEPVAKQKVTGGGEDDLFSFFKVKVQPNTTPNGKLSVGQIFLNKSKN